MVAASDHFRVGSPSAQDDGSAYAELQIKPYTAVPAVFDSNQPKSMP